MKSIVSVRHLLVVACLGITAVKAQNDSTKFWKKGGFFSVTFNQVALSNWAAGGQSAVSTSAVLNCFANYKREKAAWDNSLDLGYGLIQSNGDPWRKNDDKIDFNSKYGYLAYGKSLYYSALLNFKSQFADGFNYPNDSVVVSRFLAPGYLTGALGMDYKPNDFFTVFVSPATGKFTFVTYQPLADAGAFGVNAAVYDTSNAKIKGGANMRAEFGAYIRARFQKDVIKNVNVLSTINLFNNYTDKNKANRKNIDVSWETLVNIKANKWLTTSVFLHLIYDNDINLPTMKKVNGVETKVGEGPKLQLKEVLGIGLSYKF